jgi:hypothetical protein
MCRIDVPMALPLAKDTRDVAVEDIELVGSTVEGVVRVRNIASEKWFAVRSGRQNRRSPRGTRSPLPIAPWTALSSQSNWQTFLPTRRRTPSISLFDIRSPAAKSGIITVVETTMSKSCVRRCRRLTRRLWLRNLRGLPMRIISQICGTNSRRHSSPGRSSDAQPRVADGDCRLRHQGPLVEIRHRHRALNQRVPLQRNMISPHRCVHPGTFSLTRRH